MPTQILTPTPCRLCGLPEAACRCPCPAANLVEPPIRVTLTLRSLEDDVPAAVRLKRLLKAALRSYGFRVERCTDVEDET